MSGSFQSGSTICKLPSSWPLGQSEATTAPEHCLQKRVAWVDRQHQRRLRPDCAPKAQQAIERIELVRWPTLLAPWIEPAQRQTAEAWPWLEACAPHSAMAGLRIVGLEPSSVLRPVPG